MTKPFEARSAYKEFRKESSSNYTFTSDNYRITVSVTQLAEKVGTVDIQRVRPSERVWQGSIDEFDELVKLAHFAQANAGIARPAGR